MQVVLEGAIGSSAIPNIQQNSFTCIPPKIFDTFCNLFQYFQPDSNTLMDFGSLKAKTKISLAFYFFYILFINLHRNEFDRIKRLVLPKLFSFLHNPCKQAQLTIGILQLIDFVRNNYILVVGAFDLSINNTIPCIWFEPLLSLFLLVTKYGSKDR